MRRKKIRTHIDAVKAWLAPEQYEEAGCAFCRRFENAGVSCNGPKNCVIVPADENCGDCWVYPGKEIDLKIARYVVRNYKGGGFRAIRKLIAAKLPKEYRDKYTGAKNA